MPIFLCILFFLTSSVFACDRCVQQTRAAYYSYEPALSSGNCGYFSLAPGFNGGYLVGGVNSLYRDGAGCGACYQIRCKYENLCTKRGTKVILFDLNQSYETGLVLSKRAFTEMARQGAEEEVVRRGIVDVEYKRIPCDYTNQNLAVRVEEMSEKPDHLVVKFLYQGGQTDITGVDVAQVGSSNWSYMSRNYGAIWETRQVPKGPLKFRLRVTSGYDKKFVYTKKALPADWNEGRIYDSGVQISDIAQEDCPNCDVGVWK